MSVFLIDRSLYLSWHWAKKPKWRLQIFSSAANGWWSQSSFKSFVFPQLTAESCLCQHVKSLSISSFIWVSSKQQTVKTKTQIEIICTDTTAEKNKFLFISNLYVNMQSACICFCCIFSAVTPRLSYYRSHLGVFVCNYVIRSLRHCAETKQGLSNFLLLHQY